MSESRRTESNWVKTSIRQPGSKELLAEMILNGATLKESYANYAKELAELA